MNDTAEKILHKEKKRLRYAFAFGALVALLLFALVANINTGSVHISIRRIFEIIVLRDRTDATSYAIIWKIRLPRMMTAAILGGALALSGFLLQTFFRNPIAGPYVLGISAGAKMLLAIVTILLAGVIKTMPVGLTVVVTFIGSMLSMAIVLVFAGRVRNMSVLLVIGIMVSNICSAITDFLINFANEAQIVNLTYWSLGSFSGASWETVRYSAVIVSVTFVLTVFASKPMSAYQLGEAYAASMGVHVKMFRIVLIVLSSVLSACVTAFAGPIAFVGIAVPHITKLLFKTSKPIIMIPAVFLTGSVFCMLCDLCARTLLAPTELSLGTVTSIVGAPVVISLMLKQRKGTQ
jgi:iron complex transport system permease protein